MARFIGIILNVVFLFAMYASGVGMQYGDNLLNVMVSLYFIGTMTMVVLLSILFFLPFSIEVSALEQFKKLESSLKIKWTSALFYLIGIPLAAWFGHFGVLGLILFNLFSIVALQVVVGAVIKVYAGE
jgi:hypothetical protein